MMCNGDAIAINGCGIYPYSPMSVSILEALPFFIGETIHSVVDSLLLRNSRSSACTTQYPMNFSLILPMLELKNVCTKTNHETSILNQNPCWIIPYSPHHCTVFFQGAIVRPATLSSFAKFAAKRESILGPARFASSTAWRRWPWLMVVTAD